MPSVARNDASVLETFFKNLEEEPKNVCVYIQDALSSMIDVYKSDETPADVRSKIDDLVLSSVEKVNSELYIELNTALLTVLFSTTPAAFMLHSSLPMPFIRFQVCLPDIFACWEYRQRLGNSKSGMKPQRVFGPSYTTITKSLKRQHHSPHLCSLTLWR